MCNPSFQFMRKIRDPFAEGCRAAASIGKEEGPGLGSWIALWADEPGG